MVKDIRTGTSGSFPSNFTCCWTKNNQALVFFTANDGKTGTELWVTDGTAGGTKLLKDIRTGTSSSFPSQLTCCDSKVFFRASNGTSTGQNGTELWVSDGTAAGTKMVKDIRTGTSSSFPSNLTCHKGKLYFSAGNGSSTGQNGTELWVSDGTSAGTKIVKDIRPGTFSSSPSSFVSCGFHIVFSAFGPNGREPWITDGTTAGTREVMDIQTGTGSSSPSQLMCCGMDVFYRASGSTTGSELWVTDVNAKTPTARLVKDIRPGSNSSSPFNMTCCQAKVFFVANNGTNGGELWVTDGTTAGTRMVKDILPGTSSSFPFNLICAGTGVYFNPTGPTNGRELWFSDGTSAGTKEVCDIRKGSLSSSPSNLTICCGNLLFTANDGNTGTELHLMKSPGATAEILGEGSGDAFSQLHITNPVMGRTITVLGDCGPKGYIGLLGISPPLALPGPVPGLPGACNWLDFSMVIIWGPFPPPWFHYQVKVPNNTAFNGTQWHMQTYWCRIIPGLPLLQVSNAVKLTVGN